MGHEVSQPQQSVAFEESVNDLETFINENTETRKETAALAKLIENNDVLDNFDEETAAEPNIPDEETSEKSLVNTIEANDDNTLEHSIVQASSDDENRSFVNEAEKPQFETDCNNKTIIEEK